MSNTPSYVRYRATQLKEYRKARVAKYQAAYPRCLDCQSASLGVLFLPPGNRICTIPGVQRVSSFCLCLDCGWIGVLHKRKGE